MEIFKLFGSIFVDSSKADESISKTDKKAESLGSRFASGIKTAGKWGLAIGGAAVAGGAALFGMSTKAAEATDRVDKMSQKIGLSREAFQEWDFICSQSGTSVEKLQGGLKTLTQQVDAVTEGNVKATANFERLGVSIDDGAGNLKSQEQIFEETVIALQNMEDGTEKARLATELFGKSGQELMPLLNGAAGSVEEMKNKAHELGLIISDDAVDAGVKFTDTIDQLKRSFGAIVTNVGAVVMPMMQQFAEWIVDHMPEIQAILQKAFDVISQVVGIAVKVIQWLIDAFGKLFDGTNEAGEGIKSVLFSLGEKFKEFFDSVIVFVQSFIEGFKVFWSKYGEDIKCIIGAAWDWISGIFEIAFDFIIDILDVFSKLFQGDWEGLWESVKKLSSDLWNNLCKWYETNIKNLLNILKSIVPKMLQAGKDLFIAVWDGLKEIWTNICSWVTEKVNWLADKVMFWKKSSGSMDEGSSGNSRTAVDGSHRSGLAFVPYDGYRAELHRGERVLTAEENEDFMSNYGNTINNFEIGQLVVREEADVQKIARQLFELQERKYRGKGVLNV